LFKISFDYFIEAVGEQPKRSAAHISVTTQIMAKIGYFIPESAILHNQIIFLKAD
jgi:hypothetical protein